ncbi:CapA family protein [Robertmurraya yapensis]|uniref:CapA family protein n=1 Tax=Bacillus yapensis TaxID=2492960 RepID=A0A3S0RHY6_9BACI|nr:CapA family protein [Bacillus yapensis]RTR28818.1 CapA family protein [Bacillus yapensis]TKS94676.1 CapA family protein [Bacillus yapensis]
MESRKNTRKEQRRSSINFIIITVVICLFVAGVFLLSYLNSNNNSSVADKGEVNHTVLPKSNVQPEPKVEPNYETTIKISAAGDFTIGTDESFGYNGSFVHEADKNGLSHFVGGLNDIFKNDDLTTVNLETTLTNASQKAVKKFRFKGDPSYVEILKLGGIESVNLANNHIHDYLQQGYDDTIKTLKNANIGYFGYDNKYVTTIKDVKIGALGYEGWADTTEIRSQVSKDIEELRNQGAQIVLVHFHWGVEREYVPTASQQSLARFTVDSGADLVLGHHPHVVQGIEEYNGKFIVYSLGNFMFGGNRNPDDKDTFVFQQTFHLENGELTDTKEINVVPFSISSQTNRNDYRPTMLEGAERDRVKQKIIDVSNKINGSDWLKYETE